MFFFFLFLNKIENSELNFLCKISSLKDYHFNKTIKKFFSHDNFEIF